MWLRLAMLLAMFSLWCVAGLAQAQGSSKFDHLRTGFALQGKHSAVRCESCHISGVFKGTPKDCRSCHSPGLRAAQNASVVPANHIPTTLACDSCHNTTAFTAVRFSHATGISPGQTCAACHDGTHAQGKSADHIDTRAACSTCHTTASWSGARPDHSQFNASTSCASCHNGSKATGKPSTHIPVTANCLSCHGVSTWRPTKFNHTQVAAAGACSTCHTGAFPPADGKSANHIPYAGLAGVNVGNCDSCHKGSYSSWANGRFHANVSVSGQCASCHLTTAYGAMAKPANALHASINSGCESCHKGTSSWAVSGMAKPDHTGYTASTSCASCHDGSTAPGKPGNHIPTTLSCYSCHSPTATTWAPTKWNHTQQAVARACSSCHTGSFQGPDGKPANHIPYAAVSAAASANCDTCHASGFASWNPGKFHANVSTSTQCASCHLTSAYGTTAKPANAMHSTITGNCEGCHKATSSWVVSGAAAKPDHSLFTAATTCSSCHDGSTAAGKTARHIPTTLSCYSCHSPTGIGWAPTKWNHTQQPVARTCSTCHTGTYQGPDGKPNPHIPYTTITAAATANCDTCHKGGFASWNPGKFHANVSTTTQCAACHMTSAFGLSARPNDGVHANVTGNCESCHKTTGWASATVSHSTFTAATNCAQCHNGTDAPGKVSTHIPTTLNCYSCHNPTATTWAPTKWNHTQQAVTRTCSTCHTGTFQGPDGKPSNHIPYATVTAASSANCDTCHTSGFASWNPGKFHANVSTATQCATCHMTAAYGLTSRPNNGTHANVTGNCEACHKTTGWASATVSHSTFTAATNCAQCHNGTDAPGKVGNHIPTTLNCYSCHNPTATTWAPTKWNHTQQTVTRTCSTCHTGGYQGPDGKPANHIPYAAVSAAAAANCDTCHTSGFASWNPGKFHANVSTPTQCATCHMSAAYGLTAKPNDGIHSTVTGNCEGCHNPKAWSTATVNHSSFTAATNCAQCHNGSDAPGKPGTHIPTTLNCYSCHTPTSLTWTPTKWNHTQQTVTRVCSTCHTGGYQGPDGKPANHIPYAAVSAAATANCDTCHKGGYTSWNPGKFHANVSTSTQCASCHLSSAYGLTAKPNDGIHSTVTGNCEGCHTTTTTWSSAKVNHSTFTAATNCAQCHNGSTAPGKPGNHIPTTLNCYSCHTPTSATWTPTKWNHTQQAVTNACSSCHTGSYQGPDGKPASHIPYAAVPNASAANCDACHKGSYTSWATGKFHSNVTVTTGCNTCHATSSYGQVTKPANHIPLAQLLNGSTMDCSACHKLNTTGGFSSAAMNHNSSMGSGSGWCKSCHLSGASYLGSMTRMSSGHLGSKTDCSTSGCHRPLGTRGTAYTRW